MSHTSDKIDEHQEAENILPPLERETVFSRGGLIPRTPPKQPEPKRPRMDLESVLNSVLEMQKQLLEEMNSLKEELREEREERRLEKELLSVELTNIKKELSNCKSRLMFFERKERARNLIMYGIEEAQNEDVRATTDSIIGGRLGIQNIRIEGAHRLGPRRNQVNRPIRIICENIEVKSEVLRKKSKLKGTTIFIDEDLCIEDRELKRRNLDMIKKQRSSGRSAFLRGSTIICENKKYKLVLGPTPQDDRMEEVSKNE